ncbi:MAG TPA: hypothetical protein VHB79_02755 [Polyangiaceae bacterium]|nr:hypothetical protein [Polyangiaceae bacterium]
MAAGCADDNRPIGPLEPEAGETNQGGSSAGTSQGGKAGSALGGKSSQGGTNGGSTANGGKGGSTIGGASAAGEGGAATTGAGGEAGGVEPGMGGGAPAGGADGSAGAGGDAAVSEPAPFAGPYAVVYAGTTIGVDFRPVKSAAFAANQLIDFVASNNEHRAIGTASNHEADHDALMQWGRWADGKMGETDMVTLSATQGFHYAIGAASAALPANGTQDYELVAATPVTVGDGSKALGTATASATVAFSATTHVGATFSLTIDGVTYTVTTTGGTATPGTSEVTAWLPQYPWLVSGIPATKPTTGICADTCNLSIQGIFAGANAEELAFAVHIFDGAGGSASSISSVFVLKKKT